MHCVKEVAFATNTLIQMFHSVIILLAACCLASATTLFVSSYAGTVTSLSLTENGGNFTLEEVSVSEDCAPNPSWLTLDASRGLLFCLNEGLETQNGSLSSFLVNRNGSLTFVRNETTISGPVSGIIYGEPAGHRAIALAHYSGSAVSSWSLLERGDFEFNQDLVFTLNKTGPVANRQEAPHEHEAIVDPTGQYILVPDLGADLIRVFSWETEDLQLTELSPLRTEPGTGPRHAAFWNPYGVACEECTTYLYVTNELASTVTGYAVTYELDGGGLSFEEVFNTSTLGNTTTPRINAPAEIHVAPDNRYLIISNRNDTSFNVSNPDPNNSTSILSDSIATFSLNNNGSLSFVQLAPVYGSFPRHFSTNAIGNLVAVGLQQSSEVVVLSRDVGTGLIGEPIASIGTEGQVTAVVFNEEYALGRLGI